MVVRILYQALFASTRASRYKFKKSHTLEINDESNQYTFYVNWNRAYTATECIYVGYFHIFNFK